VQVQEVTAIPDDDRRKGLCIREELHRLPSRVTRPTPASAVAERLTIFPAMIAKGFFIGETAFPKFEVIKLKMLYCSPTA
jgi:hypothetical protein